MTTYLDSTATTKPTDLALRSFNEISRNCWGNPSSTLYDIVNNSLHFSLKNIRPYAISFCES